jgi:anaerobic dimethyl sulfoxide reductase subunit B (iron-sulfur subunit)
MTQYGFFFDQSRCIGCQSCVVACKQWHDIAPGPVKWMRVYQWEKGGFPAIKLNMLAINCYHCKRPVCVKACPNEALSKEDKYGAVLVNHDRCKGARKCSLACPYGAPQFASNDAGEKMSKCTMCVDRLEEGKNPICVLACSMRAMEFGPIEELEKKYGTLKRLTDMPKETMTQPAVVFRPTDPKENIVPYDPIRSLELWRTREPCKGKSLPDVFGDINDVIQDPQEIVGRNKLTLKAKTIEEEMYYTVDDD